MSIHADTLYPGSKHLLPILPATRPPRTEPTYPPEPEEALAKIGGPSPFRAAERQPPRIVLTADEAAERMRKLKDGEPAGDPLLKLQIVELQAKLMEQRIRVDDVIATMEAAYKRLDGLVDLCKAQQQEMRDIRKILIGHDQTFSAIINRPAPSSVAAADGGKVARYGKSLDKLPPAKKTAAKRPKRA